MRIEQLVEMAERMHDEEGVNLGSSSTREYRNAFWARVIGCAYHGHPKYNPNPDKQWHLKKADASRPQTDDVATSMPSRGYWDCINGVGQDGYLFAATPHGPLPADQIVYAPPVPDGSGSLPLPEPPPHVCPAPFIPGYEDLGGDSGFRADIGAALQADLVSVGRAFDDGSSVWFSRPIFEYIVECVKAGRVIDRKPIVRKYRQQWRDNLSQQGATPVGGWPLLP